MFCSYAPEDGQRGCRSRRRSSQAAASAGLQRLPPGSHKVSLVIVPLLGLPGAVAGYHTSVLLEKVELAFESTGIRKTLGRNASPNRITIGSTRRSVRELETFLRPYFKPGTYDMLTKNCNSFTDAALYFLCGVRLEDSYRSTEQLGVSLGLAPLLALGGYAASATAEEFRVDDVVAAIEDSEMFCRKAASRPASSPNRRHSGASTVTLRL